MSTPLNVGQTIPMATMIEAAFSMEATNNTHPSNESRIMTHPSSWEPAIPAIVIFAILGWILYLIISCHRRPFGEVIRPRFTILLFGHVPTFGDGSVPIEMRERDVPDHSYA